jgi:hypothetical protein
MGEHEMPRLGALREKAAFAASRDTGRGTHPVPATHSASVASLTTEYGT